jgi:hypothetical protein
VETVRKFGYGDSQCEAILDVSRKTRTHCAVQPHSYTIIPLSKIPRG